MGKVIYPRKGEVHTAPVPFAENFSDNTWAQIIEACETNTVPDTWVVGDQKAMTFGNVEYLIDIIGKNHDEYSDGSGYAPLTFQMHNCYGGIPFPKMNSTNTNIGGWASCEMRTTNAPSVIANMPSEVQVAIKEVTKLTSSGNATSTIRTTADKVFILSEIEVFGAATNSVSGEGSQYLYYASGNSTVKTMGVTAREWWLRSPLKGSTTRFCNVSAAGKSFAGDANTVKYTPFAFCF